METRQFPTECRVVGTRIQGKIPYDSESRDLGGFTEMLTPGCFSESIRSGVIVSLWNHESGQPLASTSNGSLQITDKRDAIHFTIFPGNTTWGKDALSAVRDGTVDGVSFGFTCEKERWEGKLRHVEKGTLKEISPCTFPAYPAAKIEARAKYGGHKNMNINELYEQRNKAFAEMRRLDDKWASKPMDIDDQATYDRAEADFDRLTGEIEAAKRNKRVGELDDYLNQSVRKPPFEQPYTDYHIERETRTQGWEPGEIRFFPPGSMTPEALGLSNGYSTRNTPEDKYFQTYLTRGLIGLDERAKQYFEQRALMIDSDISGGFLVAPQQFMAQVIVKQDNLVFVRRYATKLVMESAQSIGCPSLETDVSAADWTSEIRTGSEDTSMSLGKREMHPYPLAKRIKVSKPLARRSQAKNLVVDRLGFQTAAAQENGFLNGNGVNRPLGLLVDSDFGITSSRDTTTSVVAGLKADDLIDVKYALKGQYRRNCRWIVSRDFVKRCRKLKDGEGQYLWKAGLSADRPDTLLDLPFDESEYFDDWATGTYQGILGDMSFYWIADALSAEIQVLTELYAETNQNGYIIRSECDGMPVIEEAFQRIKIG